MSIIVGFNEHTGQKYTLDNDSQGLISYSEPCEYFTISAFEDPDGDCEAHIIDSEENELLSTYGHSCLDDALSELAAYLTDPDICPDDLLSLPWRPSTIGD